MVRIEGAGEERERRGWRDHHHYHHRRFVVVVDGVGVTTFIQQCST